jgi:hypothetical protein
MIKKILIYSFVFFSLFFLSFSLHEYFLENQLNSLPYSLRKVYVFHLAFSLLICINFEAFSSVDKVFEQLGFVYLFTLFLKIILFCAVFYKPIFQEENLSQIARTSLFIPMIIFLLTEAVFVAKILIKKE